MPALEKRCVKISFGLTVGLFLIVSGIMNLTLVPVLIKRTLSESLVIRDGSETFMSWKDLPVPISTEFFLFNVTNPREVSLGLEVPDLKEVGPIVFREERHKINVVFSEDGNFVEYDNVRRWFFDEEKSIVSLDSIITHLNVPLVTSSDFVSKLKMDPREKVFLYYSINQMHSLTRSSLFERHSIRQLLFEGYSDTLIQEARLLKFEGMTVPFDRFGWFYGRNNTSSDGHFKVFTGKGDIKRIGQLHSWRNSTQLNHFRGDCRKLTEVATDFFPPFSDDISESSRQKVPIGTQVRLFVGDICRPFTLHFEGERRRFGVKTHRYSFNKDSVDNSLVDNKCYCSGVGGVSTGCPPRGVIDTSHCSFDAPSAVSLPHFLFGEPALRRSLTGLQPDFNKHSFNIHVHPVLGIPVSAQISMQINIRIRKEDKVTKVSQVKFDDLFLPVLWFKAKVELPEEMTNKLIILDRIPMYLCLISWTLIGTGLTLIVTIMLFFREDIAISTFNWRNRRRLQTIQRYRKKVLKQYDSEVNSIAMSPFNTAIQTRSSF
jgi:hypothetical protein